MNNASLHSQLTKRLHQRVRPEAFLLLVFLKVPGAQRHLTLQAALHRHRWFIDALVTENLRSLRFGLKIPLQLCIGCSETLHDVAQFEVFLKGGHILEFLTTFWATWRRWVRFVGRAGSHNASTAVAVSAREDHWITEQVKADGAAQLMDKRLHWVGGRHPENRRLQLQPKHCGTISLSLQFSYASICLTEPLSLLVNVVNR